MKTAFAFLFLLLSGRLAAQENFGSLSSNYMPTNSVHINPSSMLDAKTRLDINIVSAGVFVMNNIVYLENTSIAGLLSDRGYENPNFDIKLDRRKYHAYNRNFVQGPGFVFSQGDHAFGLSLGLKSFTHVRKIPGEVIRAVATLEVPEDRSVNGKNFSMTSMSYGEAKFSYAYTFLKKKRELFMGGISLNKYIPIQAAATKVREAKAEIVSDSLGYVFDMDADNVYLQADTFTFFSNFGVDLGFTYERMQSESYNHLPNSGKNNCRRNYYLYKIGVSLMDLGSLKFEEENVEYIGIKASDYNFTREEFSEDNINVLENLQGNALVTTDQSAAFVRKLNKVRLPSYVSLQGDYNAWNNKFYVNLTWVQRFPLSDKSLGVARSNSLSLTPRYESRLFEAALPLSLYEYTYPQIGLMLRFWFLTVGTDKLGSILFNSNMYGTDFYFALKIPIAYHPDCRDGKKDRFNYYPKKFRWRSKSCNGM
ncbi:MAG: hypothetical protein K0R65_1401 [Crocinitomicaceae bacterium]|jgi:hypothetical protein|nr:hypothetical protein [Crocinitomicaceae bacterium]